MVGKVFCKVVNKRLVQYLNSGGGLHEGQVGFCVGGGRVGGVCVLNEVVWGRLGEDKVTYAFFFRCKESS